MTDREFQLIKSRLKEQSLNVDEAMLMLYPMLKDGEMSNHLIVLQSQSKNLKKKGWIGLSLDEETRQRSKITHNFLEFIDEITMGDLNKNAELKILVICPYKHSQGEMKQYFNKFPQINPTVVVGSENPSLKGFDVIIFDNQRLPALISEAAESDAMEKVDVVLRNHLELMKEVLSGTVKYFIHLGEYNYLINDYREKAHAANSKFALYSRVNEVLEYIQVTKDYLSQP